MNEREIFLGALDREAVGERTTYLDEVCAGDPELRRRVESLLAAHESAGSFLEHPPADVVDSEVTVREGGSQSRPGLGEERFDVSLDFLAPPQQPGELGALGPYAVTEVIGRGGMGIVLKAFDSKLNRVVAIKVLAPEWAANPTARKRFLREAQAAAAIRHDHVVTIYAIDETDRLPYIVMEFVSGVSLQERIDQSGPLELQDILRIGRQTAAGLAAAHAEGLVHRDIKPANILLENGIQRVKITDFGLARAVDDVGTTRTGTVAGTPQYMSPEQARGEYVDHRTDLFSLGCVMYAMCTGRSPFRADSTVAVIRRVCDETPRPIRQVSPEVPEWLVAIIDRLLAKDADQRFQSAAEVADVLGQRLAQVQHAAVSPPEAAPLKRGSSGRHWVSAAVVLLVVLAGLGATEATGVTRFASTVVRVVTGEGTLVVEVDDPSVSVTIDGEDLVITGAGPREVRLRPGTYRVTATRDGEPVKEELVRITRGDREVVTVSRLRGETEAPSDEPKVLAEFRPGEAVETITRDGVEIRDGAWKIVADESRTVRLFEVESLNAENCMLVYRARLKAEELRGKAYLEMWVRAPGRGEFFSKDLDDPISGTTGWATYETPFFLQKGEQVDLAKLNLVVEGQGTVWIKDVELLKLPLPETARAPVTQADPPAIRLLEQLVELAQGRLDRVKRLHERKAASSEDLRSALAALIDAQAQLAEARGSRSELIELHRRRVELARERLEQVEMLREKNAAGAVELVDAREALIRAQIRLELVTGA